MSGGHDHGSLGSAQFTKPLAIAFGLVLSFAIVEFVAGMASGSLALTADAGHMATDALGIGMALAAAVVSKRVRPNSGQTFGLYRIEILAALANAVLLLGVATYVIIEAIDRIRDPGDIDSTLMIAVAFGGLIVNLISFRLLSEGARESLNVEGAFLEVMGDTLASVGVIVAGVVIVLTGWVTIDAIVGIAIGLFILPRAFSLARRATRILMEVAPAGIDVEEMREALGALPSVVEVHDLHLWTLTSEMHTATAHLVIRDGVESHPTLDAARDALSGRFGIDHATLQIEPESHTGCSEVAW
jgi:cobalt-zinc-cadmium efflux system protein